MPEFKANRVLIGSRVLLLGLVLVALLLAGGADHRDTHVSVLIDQSAVVAAGAAAIAKRTLGEDLQRVSIEIVNVADTASLPALFGQTLRQLEPVARNGIVIASHGYWPAGMEGLLDRTVAAGIPVFWFPVAVAEPKPRILAIDSPARSRVGEQVSVTVRTVLPEPGTYRVVVFANGEPAGQQDLAAGASASIKVDVATSGVLQIDAELLDGRTGRLLDRLQGGALVNVVSTPRLLILADGDSPVAASLTDGGWSVTRMTPREFQARSSPVSRYSAIILDDVAANALPEAAWKQIAESVQRDALGLLVLGGPQSFGLGGYRGSSLEELLPVISEPPADEPPASLLFVVDVSGSMAREAAVADKLRAAQAAVLNTAAALRPQDRVGLIAFDVEAQQLLSVAPRDDHAAAIRQVWPAAASGGTSLTPALDLAQAALAEETAEQKLLFLVTDGMLSEADIGSLEARLAAGEFELSAMIIPDGPGDVPVSRLALGERGSILIVDDVMRLPVLMRDELEERRPALEMIRTMPSVLSPLPMTSPPAAWPAVDAYLLTRARPGATVMLATDRKDPILAAWTVGTGRVVALTSGLNRWATDWLTWERWPALVAGLLNHIAVRHESAARLDDGDSPSGRQALLVERGSRDSVDATTAQLVLPNGSVQTVPLVPEAPGLYRADVETEQVGRYTLVWEDATGPRRHSFNRGPRRDEDHTGQPVARRFVEMGLLHEWSDEWSSDLAGEVPVKMILVALALFGLLFAIAAERVPLSQVRRLLLSGRLRLHGEGDRA